MCASANTPLTDVVIILKDVLSLGYSASQIYVPRRLARHAPLSELAPSCSSASTRLRMVSFRVFFVVGFLVGVAAPESSVRSAIPLGIGDLSPPFSAGPHYREAAASSPDEGTRILDA